MDQKQFEYRLERFGKSSTNPAGSAGNQGGELRGGGRRGGGKVNPNEDSRNSRTQVVGVLRLEASRSESRRGKRSPSAAIMRVSFTRSCVKFLANPSPLSPLVRGGEEGDGLWRKDASYVALPRRVPCPRHAREENRPLALACSLECANILVVVVVVVMVLRPPPSPRKKSRARFA